MNKKLEQEINAAAEKYANQDCVVFISRKQAFIAGAKFIYGLGFMNVKQEDKEKLKHIIEIVHLAPGSLASIDEKEELENFLRTFIF